MRPKGWMQAMPVIRQAPMPMAIRRVKSAHATAMAETVARAATGVSVQSARSAASARTVHRLTTSSRWKALQLIPEDQMHCQPP